MTQQKDLNGQFWWNYTQNGMGWQQLENLTAQSGHETLMEKEETQSIHWR